MSNDPDGYQRIGTYDGKPLAVFYTCRVCGSAVVDTDLHSATHE